MNILIKIIISLVPATIFSFAIAAGVLAILNLIVHIFKLNYGRDTYWIFNVASLSFIISGIIIFGIFMNSQWFNLV